MPVIQHLLQRWGFVKLDRYGLVVTPEDRILSIRPEVLGDSAGGRVVGWQDDDLAMFELSTQRSVRATGSPVPPGLQGVASRVAVPPAAAPEQVAIPVVVPVLSVSEPVPPVPSEAVMPVAVAPGAVVDEDDWEWTIALARARASAEDAEAAAAAGPPRPSPRPSPARTRPMVTVAVKAPVLQAAPMVAPTVAPTVAIAPEDPAQDVTQLGVAIPRAVPAASVPAASPAAARATVIPVPVLPTMRSATRTSRLEPVVRASSSPAGPASQPRFAHGTGAVDQSSPGGAPALPVDKHPNLSVGDRTTPGIALPPAARAVQLPSVKRRLAQRR
jgi:hypothetical protein